MTAVLQLPPPDLGDLSLGVVQESFSRRLTVTDAELKDSRLPPLPSSSKHLSLDTQMAAAQGTVPATTAAAPSSPPDRNTDTLLTDGSRATSWIEYTPVSGRYPSYSGGWIADKVVEEPAEEDPQQQARQQQELQPAAREHTHEHAEARLPDGMYPGAYMSPSGSPAYVQHHDGLQDRPQDRLQDRPHRPPNALDSPRTHDTGFRVSIDPGSVFPSPDMGQRASGVDHYREKSAQLQPSSPRHPALPTATTPALPTATTPANANANASSSPTMPPIVPLSAGPSYGSIPISPNPRAYAQQPTYITPTSAAPSPINPVYSPRQPQREEVCVECAMRDQDMADVDVTSPGVWERESDALYEDLLRRDEEEEVAGLPTHENASRPKARGDLLTEDRLKLWISVNPKEPSSRQQTLDQYVKAQRQLLEAEALAHARAMRESRQLDDKMRDAYTQLRRSAYELGSSAQPSDDTGGVRIKAPRSPSIPAALHNNSREVTLLENGMIVEHVDVRKEEREERERRRKEEKRERSRVRKTSRSSRAADAMSVYSLQTPLYTDSGFFSGVKSDSRYSQSISASQRPNSVMTGGGERPHTLLRAQSQASFSDMQSVGSAASPRRSRFFGLKNLSSGWRSQDSLAPSGSMIDMHVALQREQQYFQSMPHPDAVDMGSNSPTVRLGESWPPLSGQGEPLAQEVQATKKAKGFKKIWRLVTGSAHHKGEAHTSGHGQSRSLERAEDDLPLAPPPPLSYLVNREQGAASGRRHVSTPSLPSSISPNTLSPYAPSPPTAPSSLVPSPTSSRRSTAAEKDASGHGNGELDDQVPLQDTSFPDSDSRGRTTQSSRTLSSSAGPLTPPLPSASPKGMASPILHRDKSLPPLPGEAVEFPNHTVHPVPESRPQTVFTYDPRTIVEGLSPPQAPFRTADTRRQSFGGLGSKGQFFSQTLPGRKTFARATAAPSFLVEERYAEFGSQRALGQWPGAQCSQPSLQVGMSTVERVKKRKSRFGLGALFGGGRKAHEHEGGGNGHAGGYAGEPHADYASSFRPSRSETPLDGPMAHGGYSSGHASPLSTSTHAPRVSVASRKNLEELVDQDPEFVAYRYPSNDQRLDLLR